MKEVWELNLKNDVENLLNLLRDKSNEFGNFPQQLRELPN